ncbi:snoRNA-binding rRNA-processing protein [Scheffersomyces spartinae]|uniref:SnoRNA-binding rRNA-processing protein n=1 Tax=Scheffersomyces spartinae TaxID=45513 RepID=A0A9P7V4R8_9ASCO|nr:snoRNA-binding rRNA-processing protein [Scheffersomyces spartinae]KAG7191295.1 snoRNA-binding rRNA-processing protein [Scheffersomyces spartinae]
MGKISVSDSRSKQRHDPLYKDLSTQGGNLRETPRLTKQKKEQQDEGFLDATTSRKILQLAKEQQEEIDDEDETEGPSFLESFKQRRGMEEDDEAEDSGDDSEEEEYSDFEGEDYFEEEEIEVDEKDAELFNKYLGGGNGGTINLADKIMAKIQEKEMMKNQPQERPQDAVLLPPKVIAAYEKIGQILASYKHGKLPKLFKVLPSLKNWEDVLFVTNPEQWTPHAVYEGTKLFVSNLQANEAQKYVESVLLEKFRVSIEDSEDHSLNYHLYRALKKSLYKPGAFFKGFLFPLVDSGCSVREATIAASVLAKASVPVLHSSVALSLLCQRDFKPATTVFIRVLIEKKYALPYQTIDELVFYFMRFRRVEAQEELMDVEGAQKANELPPLPVVWHKAFLSFAQRYKNDITDDQRDFLLETVRQRFHHLIGPEIRRELLAGVPRLPPAAKDVSM